VTLTAHGSDIVKDLDTETMDLNKKNQESSQICRVMYQKPKKEDNTPEGYWIYHKNHVDLNTIYTNPEEKLWYVVSKYPKDSFKSKGLKLEKNTIIRMGRIRLRVRDIDYPEPKNDPEVKSQRSQSPRSYRSRGNKTGGSSNRRNSNESCVDINDIDISQRGEIRVEGNVGLDGGIELANDANIDLQTMKN